MQRSLARFKGPEDAFWWLRVLLNTHRKTEAGREDKHGGVASPTPYQRRDVSGRARHSQATPQPAESRWVFRRTLPGADCFLSPPPPCPTIAKR